MRRVAVTVALALAAMLLIAGGTAIATDLPVASFTSSPSSALIGQTVAFDGSASSDPDGDAIAQYSWTFGDGDSQLTTAPSASHVYAKPGSYTATLVVTDGQGNASAAASQTVDVTSVETTPHAHFKVTPKRPHAAQVAVFDGSRSHDDDGDLITSYRWTFGDGTSQTTTSATVAHTYASSGSFIATLSVLDSRGNASGVYARTIRVRKPQQVTTGPPVGQFDYSPAAPSAGQLVSFDGSASNGGGLSIRRYLWSFGDGQAARTRSPFVAHAYSLVGTYSVELVVKTSQGTYSAPVTKEVVVGPGTGAVTLWHLRVKACHHLSWRCAARGLRIRFHLSTADSVTLTLYRGHRTLKSVVVSGQAGRNSVTIDFHGRRHARYAVAATPEGGATVIRRFRWRRW